MNSSQPELPAQAAELIPAAALGELEQGDAMIRRGAAWFVRGAYLVGRAFLRVPKGQREAEAERRGYNPRVVRRWMRMARERQWEDVQPFASWREAERELLGVVHAPQLARPGSDGTHDKGDQRWYTPPEVIEPVRAALGGIQLDPASCAEANAVVRADAYHDEAADGLRQPWRGTVFLNPPYALSLKTAFLERLAASYRLNGGEVTAAVVLLPVDTSAQWFEPVRPWTTAQVSIRGRVTFWGPAASRHPMGSQLVYVGTEPERFEAATAHLGDVGRLGFSGLHWMRWLLSLVDGASLDDPELAEALGLAPAEAAMLRLLRPCC